MHACTDAHITQKRSNPTKQSLRDILDNTNAGTVTLKPVSD